MAAVYSRLKVFNYKEKVDSLPRDVPAILPPLHIRIKPTNICGHKCSYCAYSEDNFLCFGKTNVPRVHIPKDKMVEIIEDISSMGVKALTFSGGGDPLVYPHIRETLRLLAPSEVKFATLTNGAGLRGEVAEVFAHRGSWVRVSMDGWDDESYVMYRRVKDGEYSRIMRNMEEFRRLGGDCSLGVSLIIDHRNVPHVFEMLRRLKNAGVNSVKLSPCLVNDSAKENNEYHQPFFMQVAEQIESAMAELAGGDFEIFNAYAALDEKFDKDYTWCPYLQVLSVIGADLNVYSCPDKAYNLDSGKIGSIVDQRFRDFWFANKDVFFRINPSRDCCHHCEANFKNTLVLEYLNAREGNMEFV
jgi:MoaA/NifB/PqqE/SkfB family radical SAM enzyme